ncbi:hypothetical protein K438DRAFT_1973326 [Mycena galopus ATCC 62051]|nr:hypothetical protein K438DRAFT_1973326 [Mycena galopus ATCC 62051]
MLALKESADAFPPLKSAIGGAIALFEITERTKHSKSDALAIALRVKEIVDVVADAVPDGSDISPSMSDSIYRFSVLLDEIRCALEEIFLAGSLSRAIRLNRNESQLLSFKTKLDDAYRDFLAASTLRLEVQQTQLVIQQNQFTVQQKKFAMQQTQSHLELQRISVKTTRLLFYSQFMVFLSSPHLPSCDRYIIYT